MSDDVWTPPAALAEQSRMAAFMVWAAAREGLALPDYAALWTWSVEQPCAFWQAVADWAGVAFATPPRAALEAATMPGAVWFPGATLNYAAHVFSHARPGRCAIRHQAEDGAMRDMDWAALQARTAALAASLRRLGVEPGDRVVGYLPNTPETVIAFLATVSIGAVWSLCAPDMGAPTVLERFRQIEPKALITATAYDFGGRRRDRAAEVSALLAGLPTVAVWVSMDDAAGVDAALPRHDWGALTAGEATFAPVMVAFDHPLWVVYSSGTTGAPKAIVHGHGGVMLEHLKLLGLHCDLGPEDVFAWYSSTGWIMWNVQVGGLLTGATIALAEGGPGFPDAGRLWRFMAQAGVTAFGAGAAWYAACMKAGVVPRQEADLSRVRFMGSTGSPLAPEAYAWLYDTMRPDIWIAPIAGGTDLAGVFLAGAPILPVRVGEMQCRALGAAVHAFDDAGQPVIDTVGELVCTAPMPSMPLYLWGDADGRRLRDSYFDTFPGVWRQGDWVTIQPDGAAIIFGRSDATINRHGVRMGTADIYRVVEAMPAVADSLVVDLEYLGKPSCMVMFVKLSPSAALDDALKAETASALKARVSPHHTPDLIVAAPDIPYTLTGKKMEVPIKRRLLGAPMAQVATADAMANPACLAWYDAFADSFSR